MQSYSAHYAYALLLLRLKGTRSLSNPLTPYCTVLPTTCRFNPHTHPHLHTYYPRLASYH